MSHSSPRSHTFRSAARRWRHVVLAAAAGVAVSCGSPNAPTPQPPPPPALTISCPAAVDASSPDGNPVPVQYAAPQTSGGTPPVTVSCAVTSGAMFAVGVTSVLCSATDARSATAFCSFNVRVSAPPRLAYTRFAAFGDSLTWGVDSPPAPARTALLSPDPPPSFSYPSRLRDRLAARYPRQAITVLNAGIPGEYAADIPGQPSGLRRFRDLARAYDPQVILLMEGSNDLLSGQNGADAAIAALEAMVRDARDQGRQVGLATIPPQRPDGTRNRGPVAALIPGFNQRIREMAATYDHVVLVDVFAAMSGDLSLIGADDLHPTVTGFQVIADTFFEAITSNFDEMQGAAARSAERR